MNDRKNEDMIEYRTFLLASVLNAVVKERGTRLRSRDKDLGV
jgi:hypothetical protein